ncbi:MAG: hypothetical protein AAF501_16035 [Pseudomonadota bacterium]
MDNPGGDCRQLKRQLAHSPGAVLPTAALGCTYKDLLEHDTDHPARTTALSGMLFQIHGRADRSVDFRSQTPDKQTAPEVTEDQTRSEHIAGALAGECPKADV